MTLRPRIIIRAIAEATLPCSDMFTKVKRLVRAIKEGDMTYIRGEVRDKVITVPAANPDSRQTQVKKESMRVTMMAGRGRYQRNQMKVSVFFQ